MKKILVSILAVFYLTSSVGAIVHLHYCMDKLVNWCLLKSEGNKCDKCGMEKDGGCCKDEEKVIKNNVDQSVVGPVAPSTQGFSTAVLFPFINTSEDRFSSLIEKYPICHAPPLIGAGEIYIINRVFRI
jgi:hypothetical protein